ncbi:MAG: histidine phosphatase family protein [bacterium]
MLTPTLPADLSAFHLLRHGQSEANVRGLIASSDAAAREGFGLTVAGRQQVREQVLAARADGRLPAACQVISSPLLRARESAAIAAEVLGTTVRVDARLAERGFGELELSTDQHYERVWAADRADPAHEAWGVESTAAILARVAPLLAELQADADGAYVLCTHGDVASVLLCAAGGLALTSHRDVGAMTNGEVRSLAPRATPDLSGFRRA